MTNPVGPTAPPTASSTKPGDAALAAPTGIAYPRSPLVMTVVAIVMLIAAITNFALTFGFPNGAVVEWFLNAGTSLTLVMGAITLGILAVTLSRSSAAPRPRTLPDPLATTGVILTALAFVIWLLLGGGPFLIHLITGEGLRYMYDVNGIFWVGFVWVTGMVMGAIGYRLGAGRSNGLSIIAVSVGLLLIVPTIISGAIYALDLSN